MPSGVVEVTSATDAVSLTPVPPPSLSVTVTSSVSEAVAVPSETVRVNAMTVSEETLGAAKAVSTAFGSAKVMGSVLLWDHR